MVKQVDRVDILVARDSGMQWVSGTVVHVRLETVDGEMCERCHVKTDGGVLHANVHPLSMRAIVAEAA